MDLPLDPLWSLLLIPSRTHHPSNDCPLNWFLIYQRRGRCVPTPIPVCTAQRILPRAGEFSSSRPLARPLGHGRLSDICPIWVTNEGKWWIIRIDRGRRWGNRSGTNERRRGGDWNFGVKRGNLAVTLVSSRKGDISMLWFTIDCADIVAADKNIPRVLLGFGWGKGRSWRRCLCFCI